MNKRWTVSLIVVLCFFMANVFVAVSLQAQSKKLCCVAGTYQGFQISAAKPNCPRPEKENFTMEIKQEEPCNDKVWGTITDASSLVNNWKGTLSKGLRGCCRLVGSFTTPPGNTVKFEGNLCRKLGKWQGKGTWVEINSSNPCKGSGTWEMTQI